MPGEILRAHIQRKWSDGCYDQAPQSRVGQIVRAIKRYAGVAKKAGVGGRFTDSKVDVSWDCAKGCELEVCNLREACVGRDQSIYTRNEVLGLVKSGDYRGDTAQRDRYQAILDDLQSLGR